VPAHDGHPNDGAARLPASSWGHRFEGLERAYASKLGTGPAPTVSGVSAPDNPDPDANLVTVVTASMVPTRQTSGMASKVLVPGS
jgi:hypothetical protein